MSDLKAFERHTKKRGSSVFRGSSPISLDWLGKVVRLEGESLNQLFATLADWNRCLENLPPDMLDDLPSFDGLDLSDP